ncbi:hypothetical protein [Actinoplanes sp. NPDC051411]|uniref:hypothetical protein n=1 Tax=Actinoplanes sp. NPDC051411 TaxID=3155522 RepID=UPI003413FB7E
MSFSVHVDPDDLARQELAAGLSSAPVALPGPESDKAPAHHGATDSRQAARQRSERDHAGRATGASGGRSYAFRRS